jgi:hypothetical protein
MSKRRKREIDASEYEGWNMEPPDEKKKAAASARGRASKLKGKTGEREVVNLAKKHGLDARRLAPIQARGGSGEAPDVEAWLLDIECKLTKQPNIRAAYRQANQLRRPGQYPCAATRKTRDQGTRVGQPPEADEQWLITLSLDDFFWLMAQAKQHMERG